MMKSGARWLAILALSPLLLTGCPQQVNPDAPDASPPEVGLDAYDIPVQLGASSQPNPESLNPTCCDVTRRVKPGSIDFIAVAKDQQSGVQFVAIWETDNLTACTDASGLTSSAGPTLVGSSTVRNPPPLPSGTTTTRPTSAPDQLLAQYSLNVPGKPASCVSYFQRWDIFAEGKNWAGQTVRTKRFRFELRLP
jgi:hypothetical protein